MNGDAFFRTRRVQHLDQLSEFLRIPSISALSDHNGDVRLAAEWVAEECRRIGLSNVQILETARHPAVYAEWLGQPGLPTALIYGHHDVQPVDPLGLWQTPPFEPAVRDGKIYARGATDDKGQVFMHLKVLEAILQQQGALPLNIKLLIEGEEEIGSVNLGPVIEAHRDLLACDVVVVSDTSLYAAGVPTITYSLRGLAGLEIDLHGPRRDLHSGSYGGAAPNPIHGLVQLLASLRHPDGSVAVAGFYDQVRELTDLERQSFAALGLDEAEWAKDIGAKALPGEPGFSVLERTWTRPTLELNGIWGGFQGEGSKTVIPAVASAKITCRLVPNQDPDLVAQAIERHLVANCPAGFTLEVKRGRAGTRASMIPIDHPALLAAGAAMAEGFGSETRFIGAGGSIGVINSFSEVLGAPSVLIGFGLHEEQAHSPNEHFHLENFERGMRVLYSYWYKLAAAMGIG